MRRWFDVVTECWSDTITTRSVVTVQSLATRTDASLKHAVTSFFSVLKETTIIECVRRHVTTFYVIYFKVALQFPDFLFKKKERKLMKKKK